ncbi:hypothetical protein VP01_891g1 [Puccinia sorghi]|uniref:Fatty acid synthase meander beta sheet domain-containing protein n=1 Tax=Puccinia sorghi TaxID=27349 RepID=A0A0L6U8R7_9BASI|nr:hypothetical protein VP01_891g1 [Puccinia sorghi]
MADPEEPPGSVPMKPLTELTGKKFWPSGSIPPMAQPDILGCTNYPSHIKPLITIQPSLTITHLIMPHPIGQGSLLKTNDFVLGMNSYFLHRSSPVSDSSFTGCSKRLIGFIQHVWNCSTHFSWSQDRLSVPQIPRHLEKKICLALDFTSATEHAALFCLKLIVRTISMNLSHKKIMIFTSEPLVPTVPQGPYRAREGSQRDYGLHLNTLSCISNAVGRITLLTFQALSMPKNSAPENKQVFLLEVSNLKQYAKVIRQIVCYIHTSLKSTQSDPKYRYPPKTPWAPIHEVIEDRIHRVNKYYRNAIQLVTPALQLHNSSCPKVLSRAHQTLLRCMAEIDTAKSPSSFMIKFNGDATPVGTLCGKNRCMVLVSLDMKDSTLQLTTYPCRFQSTNSSTKEDLTAGHLVEYSWRALIGARVLQQSSRVLDGQIVTSIS